MKKKVGVTQHQKLVGRVFCFTGVLVGMTRKEAEEKVEQLGAKVAKSITKKVTDVVVGRGGGSKRAEAEKLGVKISTTKAREDRGKRVRGEHNGNPEVVAKAVPARILRKLIDNEAFMEGLTPSERAMLCWVAGHTGMDRRVRGLRAALKAVGYIDDEPSAEE